MRRVSTLRSLYLLLIYIFFYTPILILIVYSFNKAQYSLVWRGFSWHWYQVLLNNTDLWIAALHSVIIGVLAASIAMIIGLFGAMAFYQYRFVGQQFVYLLIFILIVMPDIVMGIALLVLYSVFRFNLGFYSLLIAHVTFCLPFAVITIYSRMSSIDKNLLEVAKDLGASDYVTLRKVMLPLLWPALLSAWLLSFTLSFDDVLISYFVSGPGFEILPLRIFAMVRHGIKPDINALCAIMFMLTLLLVLIGQFMFRKKQ